MDTKTLPFLMLGEAVVDFISTGVVTSLEDASLFEKFAGGEVANLAVNLASLGFQVSLGSCIGEDGLGTFHRKKMSESGLDLSLLQTSSSAPTTIIPVARQTGTPDFIIYRGADSHLELSDALLSAAGQAGAIHTSAFALSRDPCRSTILSILESVKQSNPVISIDPNYHPAIGPDRPDFLDVLKEIMQHATVIKPSLDDCVRIFGPGKDPAAYLELFLDRGPDLVVITMGGMGSLVGTSSGEIYQLHPRPVPVRDVTGAGDAFWSGLLSGLVTGLPILDSARLGQAIAEHKIGFVGPIQEHHSLEEYQEIAQGIDIRKI